MTTNTCKAKDPQSCRFHGKQTYKWALQSLEAWQKSLNVSENFARYEEVKKHIEKYEIVRDASLYGFQKLSKEFAKAVKVGSVDEQNELAIRIKKASNLRLEDGKVGKWDEAYGNAFKFGSMVLEEAKTQDVVLIPVTKSGSQDIGSLADRIRAEEGYEVTDVNVHLFSHSKISTEEEIDVVRGKVLDYLKNNRSDNLWEQVLDPNACGIRGLTFKEPSGRSVIVKAEPLKS